LEEYNVRAVFFSRFRRFFAPVPIRQTKTGFKPLKGDKFFCINKRLYPNKCEDLMLRVSPLLAGIIPKIGDKRYSLSRFYLDGGK
jgi:hypothetical protein